MWIAVCDDSKVFIEEIKVTLKGICKPDDQLTFYESGFELLNAAYTAKQPIDVLLLDMDMPGFNGLATGSELKRICPDIEIIIVTNYVKYSLAGYELHPHAYLLKPIGCKELKQKLEEIRITVEARTNKLRVISRNGQAFISTADILYVESYGRKTYIATGGDEYTSNLPLRQLYEDLKELGFFRIHKSYIVNLSHIKRINTAGKEATVQLTNDEILPVGRRNVSSLGSAIVAKRMI